MIIPHFLSNQVLSSSDRIIINYAQITDDADFNGNDVTDRDSVPSQYI